MKKAIRLIVAAALVIAPASAWAQITSPTYYGEPHVYDLREFTANLNWQSAQVRSKIDTRAGTPAPDDIRWIDRIYNLPDYMRTFYDNHGLRVQEVLNGGSNYLSNPANDNTYAKHSRDGITYVELKTITKGLSYTYSPDVVRDNPSALQDAAVNTVLQDLAVNENGYLEDVIAFIPYMFMSMSYDYPQAFWLGNYWSWLTSWGCSYGGYMNNGTDSVTYTYKVLFCIKSENYDYRIDDFRTESAIRNGIEEYNELVEDILKDLDTFIGMDEVKSAVKEMAYSVQNAMQRAERGLGEQEKMSMHIILTGNPGTGKTTIARKLGEILAAIGYLDSGHVVEVDRAKMVSPYQGETPKVVDRLCDKAMGGILFVDEAYTLAPVSQAGDRDNQGAQALEKLMKRMEDDRGKFIVIAAGRQCPDSQKSHQDSSSADTPFR